MIKVRLLSVLLEIETCSSHLLQETGLHLTFSHGVLG